MALLTKSGPLFVFVNKILLKHSHTQLFMHHPWLLSQNMVDGTEIVWPTKPKILVSGHLQKRYTDPPISDNICFFTYLDSCPIFSFLY